MSAQSWTRDELAHLVAARRARGERETEGGDAFLDFRMKVTPELLEAMLGGYWTTRHGVRIEFDGVHITDDGYLEPLYHAVQGRSVL